jgi:hypothetical protein
VQFGFVQSELAALFNANNRTEMNSAAHEIEINDMVASLEYLDIAEISRSAIEKALEYVCGVKMKDTFLLNMNLRQRARQAVELKLSSLGKIKDGTRDEIRCIFDEDRYV